MKNTQKKYELLKNDTLVHGNKTLYRIRALVDFDLVKKGDFGGYVESESNLDHDGCAWVGGNAKVYGDALVSDNAWVSGNAQVYDDAKVHGEAFVYNEAHIYGEAEVYGKAHVHGNVKIYDEAQVYDEAIVYGNAKVNGDVHVRSFAIISGLKMIFWVNNVEVNKTLAVYNGKNGLIVVQDCFTGTVDEFLSKSKKVNSNKIHEEYKSLIKAAQNRILK